MANAKSGRGKLSRAALGLLIATLTFVISSCVKAYGVEVFNPCDRAVTVILSGAWESREARTLEAAEGSLLSAATIPADAVVKVGDVDDAAGRDWGWTLWVDDADVRLDFTVRQLETRDGVLELPTAACDAPTASADEGTQVFSVAGPIRHRPYRPMQEPIGEPLRWEVLWFWLVAAVIGIPTAVHAHRKAKARMEEEA